MSSDRTHVRENQDQAVDTLAEVTTNSAAYEFAATAWKLDMARRATVGSDAILDIISKREVMGVDDYQAKGLIDALVALDALYKIAEMALQMTTDEVGSHEKH